MLSGLFPGDASQVNRDWRPGMRRSGREQHCSGGCWICGLDLWLFKGWLNYLDTGILKILLLRPIWLWAFFWVMGPAHFCCATLLMGWTTKMHELYVDKFTVAMKHKKILYKPLFLRWNNEEEKPFSVSTKTALYQQPSVLWTSERNCNITLYLCFVLFLLSCF